MDFTVTHVTRFAYQGPVSESAMEVRLVPRSDGRQEVPAFEMTTNPAATIFSYVDAFGNDVRHFDIVAPHLELVVHTRARVRTQPSRSLPERLESEAWVALRALRANGEFWDFFEPTPRVPISPAVRAFAEVLGIGGGSDPLTCLRRTVSAVHKALTYTPDSTTVDTPLQAVLDTRRGVCQDFAHVALALLRAHDIPCRYVSGYLAPATGTHAQQNLTSHAWIEAWIPGLEWTGFDPTHDREVGDHHISVAVGGDYGDAAPTHGVFRGGPAGTLSVTVEIEHTGAASRGEMRWDPAATSANAKPAFKQHDQ